MSKTCLFLGLSLTLSCAHILFLAFGFRVSLGSIVCFGQHPHSTNESDDDSSSDAVDGDEEEEEEVQPPPVQVQPRRSPGPGRGKQLRRPQADDMEESDDEDKEEEDREVVADESSDDDDDEQELDFETFDPKALVEGDDDQKMLDSLPEFEREAILGERFEKVKNKADMKRALLQSKRKEKETKLSSQPPSKPSKKTKTTAKTKKAAAAAASKATAAKTKKNARTAGDKAMAAKLSAGRESIRNRDAKGTKGKKAAALAALRKERKTVQKQKEDDEEDSDLDFGSNGDDDSDDDYEESTILKPWQKKKEKSATKTTRRAPKTTAGSSDEDPMEMDGEEDGTPTLAAGGGADGAGSRGTPEVEADLADYQKVTIPRRRLAQWCNEPFFENAVQGCYVRLGIGESDDGKKLYRLCEVIHVGVGKSMYTFPPLNRKEKPVSDNDEYPTTEKGGTTHTHIPKGVLLYLPHVVGVSAFDHCWVRVLTVSPRSLYVLVQISTNKTLTLKFGKHTKEWRMYGISDSRPNEEDMKKYVNMQKGIRSSVLSKRVANKLRKNLDSTVSNYQYTTEDIEKSVEARKKSGKSLMNFGLEQTRVKIGVQAAKGVIDEAQGRLNDAKKTLFEYSGRESDDLEKHVKEAEAALEDAKKSFDDQLAEQGKLSTKAEARKEKFSKRSKDKDWAKVNQRAALSNQTADFEAYKDQRQKAIAEAASGGSKFNPYARRKVKPKILWEVGQKEETGNKKETLEEKKSGGGDKENSNEKDDAKHGTKNALRGAGNGHIANLQKKNMVGQMHQIDFDEDGPNSFSLGSFGLNSNKRKVVRVRKGLSLSDYQERKTAGTL